jgi:hypothetical protein
VNHPPAWLPNWTKQDEYPSKTAATRIEWAWQFLRRNPEYQRAWEQHIRPDYDPSELSEPVDHGRRRRRVGRLRVEENTIFEKHFRIGTYPPPAPSEPTAKLGFIAISYAVKSKRWKEKIAPEDDQVLVVFDLNQSIEGQLADASHVLKSFQGRRQFRARVGSYRRYLRLLDAKAVGASNADIAKVLYPEIENIYPGYEGSRRVRKDLKIAERLRDHDYWRIAVGGE